MFGYPEDAIKSMYLIKTHYIMKVIEFHPEDQTVDLIQDVYEYCNTMSGNMSIKNELGYDVTVGLQKPTVLWGIPVKQLRWGQFTIQACPQPGDTGYIEVFTNDITSWVQNGGLNVPNSDRHFAKESCVFVPFVANKKNALKDYVSDEKTLVIKSKNASITLTDDGETSDVKVVAKTITMEAENGVSITGDVAIDGDVSCTKTVTADTDVVGGGVSLKDHTHQFTYSAGPTAGAQGETIAPIPQGE
jgi:hypothetical protein